MDGWMDIYLQKSHPQSGNLLQNDLGGCWKFRFLEVYSDSSAGTARNLHFHCAPHVVLCTVRLRNDRCRLGHFAGYSMALVISSFPSAVRRWSGRGQVDWGSESSDFSSLPFGFPTLRRRILISHRDAVGWKKTPGTKEAPKDCISRPAAGPQDAPQNSSQEQRLTVLGDVLLSL